MGYLNYTPGECCTEQSRLAVMIRATDGCSDVKTAGWRGSSEDGGASGSDDQNVCTVVIPVTATNISKEFRCNHTTNCSHPLG